VFGVRYLEFLSCGNLSIMATIKRFEELEIWQLARQLENSVYEETGKGKLSKDDKLSDQLNASTGSIMDNIAEGFDRGSSLEFIQFLTILKRLRK